MSSTSCLAASHHSITGYWAEGYEHHPISKIMTNSQIIFRICSECHLHWKAIVSILYTLYFILYTLPQETDSSRRIFNFMVNKEITNNVYCQTVEKKRNRIEYCIICVCTLNWKQQFNVNVSVIQDVLPGKNGHYRRCSMWCQVRFNTLNQPAVIQMLPGLVWCTLCFIAVTVQQEVCSPLWSIYLYLRSM